LRPEVDPSAVREQRRRQLAARRNEQLREPATQEFIVRMERGHLYGGKRLSVFSLMRDGRDLAAGLRESAADSHSTPIERVIQPYLQVVERGAACAET